MMRVPDTEMEYGEFEAAVMVGSGPSRPTTDCLLCALAYGAD